VLHDAGEILLRLQVENTLFDGHQVRRPCLSRDFLRSEVDRLLVDVEVRIGCDPKDAILQLDAQ